MSWLSKIFKHNNGAVQVQYGTEGKVISVNVKQNDWKLLVKGNKKYFSQKAISLLAAAEILRKIPTIPQLNYYEVDTPDGILGRDLNGFYTIAVLKTANLKIEYNLNKTNTVESKSLMDFGNMIANQSTAALLKSSGHYAKLVLMMECGQCGYKSPIETEAGEMVRQCYCCGTTNKTNRAVINVFTQKGLVQI